MKKQKVTAVFDIGKTNKKFFLFDKDYQEVYREYSSFDEIKDEDDYPTENLIALKKWLKTRFDRILKTGKYTITAINFSTYGASFVHLDKEGKLLTPLYNYTKPIPKEILEEFYSNYGEEKMIACETASPQNGALNSGMQLYWIKKTKPQIFKQIKYSLHFPQYLSYLFTGIPLSEFTSIGCHTNLWNFKTNTYHNWVYKEGIDKLLPPIVSAKTSINMTYQDKKIKVGIGIHDSSSALLPYILSKKKPFLLLSTGTWSISLNPFNKEILSKEDLENNCLNYMRIDGKRVKATRFFMGNEYRIQVEKLGEIYGKEYGYHRNVRFEKELYLQLISNKEVYFRFEGITLKRKQITKTDLKDFETFEEAYHQLMIELMDLQVKTIKMAIGNNKNIKQIYIDGGFTNNDVFVKLMAYHFKDYKIRTSKSPLGSALGAAMVIASKKINSKFLKQNYKLEKLPPLLLEV
jgi:sugar (pentulose or hexulose) kinase